MQHATETEPHTPHATRNWQRATGTVTCGRSTEEPCWWDFLFTRRTFPSTEDGATALLLSSYQVDLYKFTHLIGEENDPLCRLPTSQTSLYMTINQNLFHKLLAGLSLQDNK